MQNLASSLSCTSREDSNFKLSLIEFERALTIVPSYQILYNIGQVHQQLGHYTKALTALELYLVRGGDRVSTSRRAEVQRDLAILRGRTARFSVITEVQGAEVVLDEMILEVTPLAVQSVDAGEHLLVVRKPGFLPFTRLLVLAGGDEVSSPVTLKREALPPTALVTVARPVVEESSRTWMWIGWSTAVVLAANTAVFGLLASSSVSDLKDLRGTFGATDEQRANAQNRARRYALVADVLGGATLVTSAFSLYLTLKRPTRTSGNTTAMSTTMVRVAGPGLVMSGSF